MGIRKGNFKVIVEIKSRSFIFLEFLVYCGLDVKGFEKDEGVMF